MANPYAAVLADLRRRRDEIDTAIRAIAPLAGEAVDETIPAPRESNPPVRASKPAPRASKPPKGETARPTEALSEAAIRTALKQGHDTPKRMATAAKLPVWKVNRVLRAMEAAGSVTKTGRQRSTRYQLA